MKAFNRLYDQAFTDTSRFTGIQGGHFEYFQYVCVYSSSVHTFVSVTGVSVATAVHFLATRTGEQGWQNCKVSSFISVPLEKETKLF